MSKWQSIETAPRDGSSILAWAPPGYYEEVGIILWDHKHIEWRYQADDGDAIGDQGDGFTDYVVMTNPTHWMPLPEPPEKE